MICILIFFCLWHQVDTDRMKMSVMEGDAVTLHTDVTDVPRQTIYHIQWRFGPDKNKPTFIVIQFNKGAPVINYFNAELLRDRLQIDNQTGSLTIRNISTTDSGLYQLIKYKPFYFNVTVYARLPIPDITRDSSNYSSSSSDFVHCCGFTEAVIRLVSSAVVGMATVAIVVYDIRSRRAKRRGEHHNQSLNDGRENPGNREFNSHWTGNEYSLDEI
uniref:Immunoglobulin V-set domain-containing protein n=1 Tax=Cyprinus carpio TaxID=7962 RepID=A0A8C2BMP1_CYPCA